MPRTVTSTATSLRRDWRPALAAFLLFLASFSFGAISLSASAQAATLTVAQCNNVGPGPMGATTGMTCSVTVVNTISGGTTSSTTTVSRQCSLDPCAPGNGSTTTSSSDLVTSISQCNGSDNDAAHPIGCDVSITNNISADTPGALPVTAATVNQCVGSAGGGGGSNTCAPFPATTTNATVTQCNGSANGGGGTVNCSVDPASTVSPVIPISVNQCNGTGNAGGAVLTCRTSIRTTITAAAATPTPSASATPSTSPSPGSVSSPSASPSPATVVPTTPPATGQVTRIPTGGIQTGGGSTSGSHRGLLQLAGLGLLAGAFLILPRRGVRRGQ